MLPGLLFGTESARVLSQYAQLPLSFEPNLGQTDAKVQYLAQTGKYTLFLTGTEAVMEAAGDRHSVVRFKLDHADANAPVKGLDKQPGVSGYFIGNDPSKWRSEVPHYGRVQYTGVYPGIDVVYYGSHQQLEYDFVVNAGADPRQIRLAYDGMKGMRVDASGDLVLTTEAGEFKQHRPKVWQQIGDRRVEIAAAYRVRGRKVGIELGSYDRSRTLVIDPVVIASLEYSTYLGGSSASGDKGLGIAVDSHGAAYITGGTASTDFPTLNPYQATNKSPSLNAFITKLNPDDGTGTVTLAYSTYLGGSSSDVGSAIAVDPTGAAYITGFTTSADFPTLNAFQTALSGSRSVFVTKVNAYSGSGAVTLGYSTYLGGTGSVFYLDTAAGIAVDSMGAAYVAGFTGATNFPVLNAFQSTLKSTTANAFVTKFNPYNGTGKVTLAYSTYLGGSVQDEGTAIAVDSMGAAYVTGATSSADFPILNAYQPKLGGGTNAFVTKFNPYNGSGNVSLAYSTYLGGNSVDGANAIAVDPNGAAYVAGYASSTNFPTVYAYQDYFYAELQNAFVTKFNAYSGTGPVTVGYSTYLGGSVWDTANGIAVDSSGAAYVTGNTRSLDFPGAFAFQPVQGLKKSGNAYVTKLVGPYGNAGPVQLSYSTYLGGTNGAGDSGASIAVDANGAAYVTGIVTSSDFPTLNAFQLNLKGLRNVFVTKFAPFTAPTAAPFGYVDTPIAASTVAGAISVTGWALDAAQRPIVEIWRDPLPGEIADVNGLVFIGQAQFVPGARPDVAAVCPTCANSNDAGWGMQVLTNVLPNSDGSGGHGNGTYTFHAIAYNGTFLTDLGARTVTVNNAASKLPFGTIDTPHQGAPVAGTAYVNFGWALTPQPNMIPIDGSTILVYIDGISVGHLTKYNLLRADIPALFPGYANSNGAVGYYTIDTTKLSNGLHSIAWVATDNAGNSMGLGSRYFIVAN